MGILEGKNILVTGVLTDASIAFQVARIAQEEGANVILTAFPRPTLTQRIAKKLPSGPDNPPAVIELDVTNEEHLGGLEAQLRALGWDRIDGVVHSIGFAPQDALGGNFLNTKWEDVATAVQISAYSLKSLTMACLPLMKDGGGSVVGLTFDARAAWPVYDWMGVAKAGLESTNRYLARYLGKEGIRFNLVAAGPIKTMAAKNIPGFEGITEGCSKSAPLGWDITDVVPTAKATVALLSDWFPATTAEIVHVDGGVHAMGGQFD